MRITVVGTGYVGLVTGTCFADCGNEVTCLDIDATKIEALTRGEIPIFEPGLAELVRRNASAGRLRFTTDASEAIRDARIIFLAVGTPSAEDGSADLSALWSVAKSIAAHLHPAAIVVVKSTVPVGTNTRLYRQLCELTGRDCDVASNPEFLKEGTAIEDCTKPDRIVVGVRRPEVAETLRELYHPFLRTEHPFLTMSPESAEMTKYVANSLLATKISFINEIANLCGHMQADINDVRRGIGHDRRIGFAFLFPGVGYGGSCFPKDIRAMIAMGRDHKESMKILSAVDAVNQRQKTVLMRPIELHFDGQLEGKRIALWGLSFKPQTDDIREAPALEMIEQLLQRGASLSVHDPEALNNVRKIYGERLTYEQRPADCLRDADALLINTEWGEFRHPDLDEVKQLMKHPVVFDGRNLFEPEKMAAAGFKYYSIGRAAV